MPAAAVASETAGLPYCVTSRDPGTGTR
jgi:hypothetical protein